MKKTMMMPAVVAALAALAVAPWAIAATGETPVHGSIRVPAERPGTEENDQAEAARLAKLATLTPTQAVAAARAHATGKAGQAKLEEEDGFLVYAVPVGQAEVLVDAGNGTILATERDEADGEADEASEN